MRTFSAEAHNGKIEIYDREGFEAYVAHLDGERIQVALSVYRPQRSKSQNAYFHGVVCAAISEHTGFEVEEVKEILKYRFLRVEKDDGTVFCRPTSSLNTKDFAEFLDRCIRWAAMELNVVIEDPH